MTRCPPRRLAAWFTQVNNADGPVDVRAVTGIDDEELITAQRLRILRRVRVVVTADRAGS
jgi:hypothetical protein